MNNDIDPEIKSIRPLTSEIAKWLETIREMWFEEMSPKDDEFSRGLRRFIAGLGSSIYIFGTAVWNSFQSTTTPTINWVLSVLVIALVIGSGLGFLLGWISKRAGPVRLFLSGNALAAFLLILLFSGNQVLP